MGGGAYSESSSATAANKTATNATFGGVSFGAQGNAATSGGSSLTSNLMWYVAAAIAVAVLGALTHKKFTA